MPQGNSDWEIEILPLQSEGSGENQGGDRQTGHGEGMGGVRS
jgi:hypothetical protein